MFKKLRYKIVAAIMAVLIIVFTGTLAIIYGASYSEVYNRNENMLKKYAKEYYLNGSPSGKKLPADDIGIHKGDAFNISSFYSVALSSDDNSLISIDNDGSSSFSDDELISLSKNLISSGKDSGSSDHLLYLIDRLDNKVLVVFMDNTIIKDSISTLFRYTLIFGCFTIAALFFLSMYLAKRIVEPLEENFNKQKQFISDAGHELKTPVSVIGANTEMLSREIGENKWLSNIQFENKRMASLISQLLQLARAENAKPVMSDVNLSRLVTGGALPFESLAFENGMRLEYDIKNNIHIIGNSNELGQLVSILIDNALKHCAPNGNIVISLKTSRHTAVLEISNEGEEIPLSEREKIFERFYRIDESRSGNDNRYGLGLAIAKAIVSSHKGRISIDCSKGITTFSVSMPLYSIKL